MLADSLVDATNASFQSATSADELRAYDKSYGRKL